MSKKRQIFLDCIRRQLAKPECFYRQRECIESCLVANELPLYPSDKFLDVSHLKQLPSRQPVITEIPLSAIWGNVWLFSGNPQEFFRNLDYRILASTLLGFMRNPDNVTPVCVCRRQDRYILQDGCHRIYAAHLLNRKSILAEIEGEYLL